ncbi:hypothetical protein C8J25_101847 [Sphingomonas faeni]|uniref:Uncharacterized protein n=1 Tax=Sphingomonas faeni TaxID=185950 RepID=A0A2T5UCV2_9SPHN|nr:hypothetical protein [Sphingomonas faeni]PTW49339.1 hypothetical protein C8J25_101847 [Sphingomonas faeni]
MNTTMNRLGEAFVTLASKAKDFVEGSAHGMAERMALRPYLFDYKRRFPTAKFPMYDDDRSGRVVFEDATVQADFLAFVANPTSSKKEGK